MTDCHVCGEPRVQHRRLPIVRCVNALCSAYCYWFTIEVNKGKPAARVITESVGALPALPPAPYRGNG